MKIQSKKSLALSVGWANNGIILFYKQWRRAECFSFIGVDSDYVNVTLWAVDNHMTIRAGLQPAPPAVALVTAGFLFARHVGTRQGDGSHDGPVFISLCSGVDGNACGGTRDGGVVVAQRWHR